MEDQDILVDLIIKEMKYGQDHPFHELYTSAVFKVRINATIRKTIPEPIENVYPSSEFDHPVRFLKEYMIDEKLIEENKQSIGDYGHPVTLTLQGRKIQRKEGWLKYLSELKKNKEKNPDKIFKIIASIEAIVIIIATPIGLRMQYNSSTLLQENKQLKEQLRMLNQKDSIRNSLKMKANKPDSTKK